MKTTDSKWVYYSLKPLATVLVGNPSVSIHDYISGRGFEGTSEHSFTGIDIEVWARNFLQATDNFLKVLYNTADNAIVHPDVDRVLKVKQTLSAAISRGTTSLFQTGINEKQLMTARAAFKKALLANLSSGYDIAAVMVGSDTGETMLLRNGSRPVDQNGVPVNIAGGAAIGPLRVYPVLPLLSEQSTFAADPEADTAGRAAICRYALDFINNGAAQDTEWFKLVTADTSAIASVDTDNDLFRSLAQFVIAYPLLEEDLPVSFAPHLKYNDELSAATGAFAAMAESVLASWLTYWNDPIANPYTLDIPANAYGFTKKLGAANKYLEAVTLQISGSTSAVPVLPVLFVKDINGKYEQLDAMKITDSEYRYEYKGANKSEGTDMIIELQAADIFSPQPWFEACVVRNNFENVKSEFVYQATPVGFADPIAPAIEQNETFSIDTTTTPATEAINEFFNQLLAGTTAKPAVSIGLSYSYTVDKTNPASLPVLLIPHTAWSATLVADMMVQVNAWMAASAPPANGRFKMQVTLFGAADTPVLVLHDVQFSLGKGKD